MAAGIFTIKRVQLHRESIPSEKIKDSIEVRFDTVQ